MKSWPYINAFGVELEGGWDEPFPSSYLWNGGNGRGDEPPWPACATDENGDEQERCGDCDECYAWNRWDEDEDGDYGRYRHGDGSVNVSAHWVGEIATPPYKSWTKFAKDFDDVYPTRVNKSCGMHMHVSVNKEAADEPALYGSMMTPRFEKFIIRGMTRWGKKAGVRAGSQFWLRLEGKNDYCMAEFIPDRQWARTQKDSVRYRRFNFCYSLNNNHTLEFRFLPMFEQKELGKSALKQLLRLTNRYLAQAAKKKLSYNHSSEEMEIGEIKTEEIVVDMDISCLNIEFSWSDGRETSSPIGKEPVIPKDAKPELVEVVEIDGGSDIDEDDVDNGAHLDGYGGFSPGCECNFCVNERNRREVGCQCGSCRLDRRRMRVVGNARRERENNEE